MLTTIQDIMNNTPLESKVVVGGWVRNKRVSKDVVFLDVYDGSQQGALQLVGDSALFTSDLHGQLGAGASVLVHGTLRASQGRGQTKEVIVEAIQVLGNSGEAYPLQPKRHTLDFLRTLQHLRFRTSTFRAVFRIRHRICEAIHRFFDEQGFLYMHTPVITGADAEGAGELFSVTHDGGKGRTFFGKPTYLTVSGQLAGEAAAMGLGRIYTFGPTFRAENSNTRRHLAEFWMVEPEVAFCDLKDLCGLAETFIKYVVKEVKERCADEIAFLSKQEKYKAKRPSVSLEDRLGHVCDKPFVQITYTEAIELLQSRQGKKFTHPVDAWGVDLQTEHEQYLVQRLGGPVIVTDYPRDVKAFYMRQNEDGKTVAAMDVLLPEIGEVVGGSQREERYIKLVEAMKDKGVGVDKMRWYLDTRLFGSVPHGGFGLGLDRLVQFVTGMDNIRDVLPFPRTVGHAEG